MEMLDTFDAWGQATGEVVSRDICHAQGLWHQTVHLWVVDSLGRLLLQRRALDRESNPGRWDISAAGHIISGQSALEAVLRESYEEIGLSISAEDLQYCGRVKHGYDGPKFINREFQEIYLLQLQPDATSGAMVEYEGEIKIQIQASEVMDFTWVYLDEFWSLVDRIEHGDLTTEENMGIQILREGLVSHQLEYALMKEILS